MCSVKRGKFAPPVRILFVFHHEKNPPMGLVCVLLVRAGNELVS